MNSTANPAPLTADLFDTFANHDDWLGFGYIGGRINALTSTDPEVPACPAEVAAADAWILKHAAAQRWTAEDLFTWANSKLGRYFADVTLHAGATRRDLERATGWDLLALPAQD